MGSFSIWHWLVVVAILLILFGRGRISGLMGDIGSGIRTFRAGLRDAATETAALRQTVEQPVDPSARKDDAT